VTVDTIPVEIPLTGRRPGRPKGSGTKQRQTSVPASKKALKRALSDEARARIAAAQKARWAALKNTPARTTPSSKKPVAKAV